MTAVLVARTAVADEAGADTAVCHIMKLKP